jgi:hypothetical protein
MCPRQTTELCIASLCSFRVFYHKSHLPALVCLENSRSLSSPSNIERIQLRCPFNSVIDHGILYVSFIILRFLHERP